MLQRKIAILPERQKRKLFFHSFFVRLKARERLMDFQIGTQQCPFHYVYKRTLID